MKSPLPPIIVKLRKIRTIPQLIDIMIKGLENPKLAVDMWVYCAFYDNMCVGCAATNTLFELTDYTKEEVNSYMRNISGADDFYHLATVVDANTKVITYFEYAVNALRIGDFSQSTAYLFHMHQEIINVYETRKVKLKRITVPDDILDKLANDYYSLSSYNYKSLIPAWKALSKQLKQLNKINNETESSNIN
jgi:hypothetical protein